MNYRDITKAGFIVLATVMGYNFADTVVHAEENDVEPIQEVTTVEETDSTEEEVDNNEPIESENVSDDVNESTTPTITGGSDTNAKLTDGWSNNTMQFVQNGNYVKNDFVEIDGQRYYFDETGNKVTGFKTIENASYYFNELGVMQTGLQMVNDQDTGLALYSLRKEDGKLHYYLDNGTAYNGMVKLDGKIYYFENGIQSVGEKQANGYWYNFNENGTIATGFVNMGNSAKYFDKAGRRVSGTFAIDKVTYNTDGNGFITKATWNGVSYYCQLDSRWTWAKVGINTFGPTGCCPTTLTMIVNTLQGTNYTPLEMGRLLNSAGLFNNTKDGAGGKAIRFAANKFNLSYKNNVNMNSAKQELLKGNMIAAAVAGGKFCPYANATHEILLFGLDANGYTTAYDPGNPSNNGRVHISEIFSHPSWGNYDKEDDGPFFSLGKLSDKTLYFNISNSSAHVGNVYYTGKKVEPEVNVSFKNNDDVKIALVQGKDFKVVYSNNVNTGKGTAKIIGINNFIGSFNVGFDIIRDQMTNGIYEISTSKSENKVLDIANGSKKYGGNVQMYDSNGTVAQQFEIVKNQKGYYTIKNVGSGLYLGITSDWNTMSNYNRLIQGVSVNSKASQFIFTKNGNGTWVISSAWDNQFVFDMNSGSTKNGTIVQIYKKNGTEAQSWGLYKINNLRQDMDLMASQNKNVIKDGMYYINSSKNKGYVLDVNSGSKENFGNIQLYKYNGTVAQGWKVSHDNHGYVTFVNVGSNKAIDVYEGKAKNYQNISQYSSNNTFAQKWIVTNEGNGFKIISAINTNYVLDLSEGKVQNTSNIQAYKSNDTAAQRWYFNKYETPRQKLDNMAKQYNAAIKETTYVISSYEIPNYAIDVSNGSKANKGNVWIYQSNNTAAQKWKVKKDSVGYITFINVGSNKALDVSNGSAKNGNNIWQYEFNNTYAQKWIAKKNSDGSFTFVSAIDSNYVLDISEGKITNCQNVQLFTNNGMQTQKFKLTQI